MYSKEYERWLKNVEDSKLKEELLNLTEMEKENKFYKVLQFGTGGLRGEIGVGTNCLNIYTVGRATQGVADYIKSVGGKTAVISYDSRINSDVFAHCCARIFAESGITVYIVKELMPTPFLSFATRYYKATIGIMITASHNPAIYNGYKVYGSDGCQITDEMAKKITAFIDNNDYFSVKTKSFEDYLNSGRIRYIDDAVEDEYLEAVSLQSVYAINNLKITYSPLCGTGYRLVPKILSRFGVSEIDIVEEQSLPNGNFPTCPYPNPEKPEAMALGLERAKKNNSDILLATDPDADRVGVAVKNGESFCLLTGNEIGALLTDFLISIRKENNALPLDAIVVKTIVTSKLGEKIAQKFGVKTINVLTGFKYIGEQIGKLERVGKADTFILGFEESYGYLSGSYVRDKDAVVAVMLICQMASYYKEKGLTLVERVEELYKEFGRYEHKLLNYEFFGAAGTKKMMEILSSIRSNMPKAFAGLNVINTIDYLTQKQFDLPKANVLQFDLENNAQIIIRPSGTEPQIKIYITVAQDVEQNAILLANIKTDIDNIFTS